ncbi:hypothetical protein N7468_007370 [Penicillium chermesinum]|uniref:Pheromone-regulated membrane protein n=1 Tax=Penicillium chermesinum TaxID=63820 RepID=A0A9W9TM49_9EURO|nr:uncharacterized protein N7468_007370 [Penicillium chermesinum]KAJ5226145.1 hypothetical protein N7468_007370 [Penicillium chermesinum]
MGCGGDREKAEVTMEEKWDFLNLDDFRVKTCWTPFSYFFLWVFLIVSIAVYGVDIFTAVNLLVFSHWSGRVEPAIPFTVSRWLFAACIIASLVLLVYRWIFAIRAIRSNSVTRNYLDPLAVRIQCFRVFTREGRGWKRFLVFAELTKSKKGTEIVALYTYFAFQCKSLGAHSAESRLTITPVWMNTIFADGPRQVINAITLYSVMKADLLPGGKNAHDNSSTGIEQFFNNLKFLAEENHLQAVVLAGMLFTLIIWVLSVLKLISAVILYLIYLFHHIPREDGSLKAYCRRKISKRLMRIVRYKVDKALAKGLQLQDRMPTQPSLATMNTSPTLPSLEDKGPIVTTMSRTTTQTTLAPSFKSSATVLDKDPTLPNLEFEKPSLTRTTTQSSAMTDSDALSGTTAVMGYSPLDRPNASMPPVPPLPTNMPSHMNSTASRQTNTPTIYGSERSRGTPTSGHRNLTDAGPKSYHSYGPPVDPYAPSSSPAFEDPYYEEAQPARYNPYEPSAAPYDAYGRTGNPRSQGTARAPAHQQDPYDARSFTPASTGATPAPQGSIPPLRTMTPASYRGARTPGPQLGDPDNRPPRGYTPMGAAGPTGSEGSAYTAFNPSSTSPTNSQGPHPTMQRPPPQQVTNPILVPTLRLLAR